MEFSLIAFLILGIGWYYFENKNKKKELFERDRVIAENHNDTDYLHRLSRSESEDVRKAVAANPRTPAGILKFLASDTAHDVVVKVAENKNSSAETLLLIIRSSDGWARRIAASNPILPPSDLESLANSPESDIRYGIAKNPSTPSKTLSTLAHDENWHVRLGVATNPSSPKEVLESILTGDDDYLRDQVARTLSKLHKT